MEETKQEGSKENTEVLSIDKATILKDEAADYVRNYFRKMGGLSSRADQNTRFLWISIKRLVDIINGWNGSELISFVEGAEHNIDSVRLYPMIYKKDYKDPLRSNMLNLCLVPVLEDNEIIEENKLKTFVDIENEIGQCPPGKHCSIESPPPNSLLAAALGLTSPETSG